MHCAQTALLLSAACLASVQRSPECGISDTAFLGATMDGRFLVCPPLDGSIVLPASTDFQPLPAKRCTIGLAAGPNATLVLCAPAGLTLGGPVIHAPALVGAVSCPEPFVAPWPTVPGAIVICAVHLTILVPCTCASNPCLYGATCVCDDAGKFSCACLSGFKGERCQNNVDECALGAHNCGLNALCMDLVGSFYCSCNAGYSGNGLECAAVLKCASKPCANNATCSESGVGFACTCAPGFTGDSCAININECAKAPCLNGGTCSDKINDFACDCVSGLSGVRCGVDIDECRIVSHNCVAGTANCTNNFGSFSCFCNVGYAGNGVTLCADVNECATGAHNCIRNVALCTNMPGSFSCACALGYTGSGVICSDVNECSAIASPCTNGTVCTNLNGSFLCTCPIEGVGCNASVNRCAGSPCQNGGVCASGATNFTCRCAAGYTGATCLGNVDECAALSHNCAAASAVCTDVPGSFSCACRAGFTGTGVACANVNECLLVPVPCANGGVCVDGVASYSCACLAGFSGATCGNNVDECLLRSHNCAVDVASCTNTVGSFFCACNAGFAGDGVICADINECASAPCANGGLCVNAVRGPGFQCTCTALYAGVTCSSRLYPGAVLRVSGAGSAAANGFYTEDLQYDIFNNKMRSQYRKIDTAGRTVYNSDASFPAIYYNNGLLGIGSAWLFRVTYSTQYSMYSTAFRPPSSGWGLPALLRATLPPPVLSYV